MSHRRRLFLELLEDRRTPAVFIWDNGDPDTNLWNRDENWQGDVAPPTDGTADLVFPAGPASGAVVNNFTEGRFRSITFQGGGYDVLGNAMILDGGNLTANNPGGNPGTSVRIRPNILLQSADQSFTVTNPNARLILDGAIINTTFNVSIGGGGNITLNGGIDGRGSLEKVGSGEAIFFASNTYLGDTVIRDGTMTLSSLQAGNVLSGGITVGDDDGAPGSAILRLGFSDQTAQVSFLTIRSDGLVNLNKHETRVLDLEMGSEFGGALITSATPGTLTVLRNVKVNAAPTPSRINAILDLGGLDHRIEIENGAAAIDFESAVGITGVGDIIKTGGGVFRLGGSNTYVGTTIIRDGTLLVDPSQPQGYLATLTVGDGTGAPGSASVALARTDPFASGTAVYINADGRLDLQGFQASIDALTGTGAVCQAGGALRVGAANSSFTFSGSLGSDGELIKLGSGIFTLSSTANTMMGLLRVKEGSLNVTGEFTTAPIRVDEKATLTGTGRVGSVFVSSGGVLDPGTTLGGSLETADVTLDREGFAQFRFRRSANGDFLNLLDVFGPLKLDGPILKLSLDHDPGIGNEFILIANDGADPVVGTFQGLPQDAVFVADGLLFSINYSGGDGNDVTVTRVGTTASTIELTSSIASSVKGEPVTLTATVRSEIPSPSNPSGIVVFRDGTSELGRSVLVNGIATLTTTSLAIGTRTIRAEFLGDPVFLPSLSDPITQIVTAPPGQPVPTVTTISSSQNPSSLGQPITLQATVTPFDSSPDQFVGTVSFFHGSTLLRTVSLQGSLAFHTTSSLPPGSHEITAVYSGSMNHVGSESLPLTQVVTGNPLIPGVPPPSVPGVPPIPPSVPPAPPPPGPPSPPVPQPPPGGMPSTPLSVVAVGRGAGADPVALLTDGLSVIQQVTVGDPTARGGIRVARADVNGDGVVDLITVPGPGSPAIVRVFDGATGGLILQFDGFEDTFLGGAFVAAADLTGDGRAEIIVTPDEGGGPRVRVLRLDGSVVVDFFGINDPNFFGGVRPATGDVNGDGRADLLIGAGFGGGPRVAIFDGLSVGAGQPTKLVGDFFVFEPTLRNGVFLGAGDLTGDGFSEIVVGGGPGGGPRVFAIDGRDLIESGGQVFTQRANFFVGDMTQRGGVRVHVDDLNGDGRADIVVGAGEGALPLVTAFSGATVPTDGTPSILFSLAPFGDAIPTGVYVG